MHCRQYKRHRRTLDDGESTSDLWQGRRMRRKCGMPRWRRRAPNTLPCFRARTKRCEGGCCGVATRCCCVLSRESKASGVVSARWLISTANLLQGRKWRPRNLHEAQARKLHADREPVHNLPSLPQGLRMAGRGARVSYAHCMRWGREEVRGVGRSKAVGFDGCVSRMRCMHVCSHATD